MTAQAHGHQNSPKVAQRATESAGIGIPGRVQFIGWPNEGVEYWNAYWRGQAAHGFFDDIWADGGI
jgi:hypothetical protein